jgi:hypothetical protein
MPPGPADCGGSSLTSRPSVEAKGEVLRQSIHPGRRVPAGQKVRLVVVGPHVCGAPLNPWCYSLTTGGSLIHKPVT